MQQGRWWHPPHPPKIHSSLHRRPCRSPLASFTNNISSFHRVQPTAACTLHNTPCCVRFLHLHRNHSKSEISEQTQHAATAEMRAVCGQDKRPAWYESDLLAGSTADEGLRVVDSPLLAEHGNLLSITRARPAGNWHCKSTCSRQWRRADPSSQPATTRDQRTSSKDGSVVPRAAPKGMITLAFKWHHVWGPIGWGSLPRAINHDDRRN